MQRIEVNCLTGEQRIIDLTQEEIDALPIPVLSAPVVITEVTMRQARLALLQSGLLTQVTNAINVMTGAEGDAARITWEFSGTVEKSNPLITQLATTLNLTTQQVDDLFILANTL